MSTENSLKISHFCIDFTGKKKKKDNENSKFCLDFHISEHVNQE